MSAQLTRLTSASSDSNKGPGRDPPRLRAAQVEPYVGRRLREPGQNVIATRAAHHDSRSAVINVTLGEGREHATAGAGQHRVGDVESEHVREGTRSGVTVDMRRFGHASSSSINPLGVADTCGDVAGQRLPCASGRGAAISGDGVTPATHDVK